jgi:sugar-specific transcriptional regulator TrmB
MTAHGRAGMAHPEWLVQKLADLGIETKAARFYLAVLEMREPTVAEVAMAANVSRTSAYDIAAYLQAKGLVELDDSPRVKRRAGTKVLRAHDPSRLIGEWNERKRVLDEVVPQLREMHDRAGPFPRTSAYQGTAGIRQALFETLNWGSNLRAVMSMKDLYGAVGTEVMEGYVQERIRRKIFLHVVRSHTKDTWSRWHTSSQEYREARWAPDSYIYTMTLIIGVDAVVFLSSATEDFAVKVESAEFAEMQGNLFDVLWRISEPH